MDDHCHCPPTMDDCHPPTMDDCYPPPCEPQDSSSWNTDTAHHHNHCHPPCPPPPPPPPPYQQRDFFWNPAFRPAFNQGPYPRWSSSSSSSDSDVGAPCTVRVEAPPSATSSGDRAPLLESKVQRGGAAAGPSATEMLFVLLFWAIVAGFVYWYWFC